MLRPQVVLLLRVSGLLRVQVQLLQALRVLSGLQALRSPVSVLQAQLALGLLALLGLEASRVLVAQPSPVLALRLPHLLLVQLQPLCPVPLLWVQDLGLLQRVVVFLGALLPPLLVRLEPTELVQQAPRALQV